MCLTDSSSLVKSLVDLVGILGLVLDLSGEMGVVGLLEVWFLVYLGGRMICSIQQT